MRWILIIIFCWGVGHIQAQEARPVVNLMTWDEASMTALKEHKIVFVAVGVAPGDKEARHLLANEAVQLFLSRNTIGIGMDMESEAGRFFEQKLLKYPWPAYAFFMPYGDLLAILPVAELAGNPERLLDTGREALEKAKIKRSNSRSVVFREEKWVDLLAEAESSDRLLFVMGTDRENQVGLLMEKNVLNLDEVADFYNRHFINTVLDVSGQTEIMAKYGVTCCPFWLFLNGEGKLVLKAEGGLNEKEFIELGRLALTKAAGIVFEESTPDVLMEKAGREGKNVFLELYVPAGTERKQLEKKVLRDPEVAAFFATHFISGSYDMLQEEGKALREKYAVVLPQTFCFTDARGNLLHEVGSVESADELIAEARRVVEGNGLAAMREKYGKGERTADFVEEYIGVLGRAGRVEIANEVAGAHLSALGGNCLKQRKYWDIYAAYVVDAFSDLFDYVREHREKLGELYGQQVVDGKIRELWRAGAGSFVKETEQGAKFDEAGYKEYVKRMKKEKVDGWRNIAREARMEIAEKTGDWRTYTELAEERWNEENVPEAELYAWGVKINENCRDKSIRFKAARWFALAAVEMEKKERLSGKVNLTSYKGFFEKLVDELIQ